ncbi:metal-dependent hydrolase [Reyranella sp.]|uniref:metal-dependent hydrolase n=1 Tax=Reyranella sp. TaxID=1929291 RepID=UPI003BAB25AB
MRFVPPRIVQRRVDIDFAHVPPGPWFPDGGPLEILFNAASIAFPPTERFFIGAVRDCLGQVSDPKLREEVAGFIHQEAMHNKVHAHCNAMLARHYPNCRRTEQISIVTFRLLGRLPRWFRLSLSSALEHFTSMVADTLLRYPDEFRQVVPPEIADMWLWHAAEETEHKSVCIDVYRAVLGNGPLSYLNRVVGMLLATPLFLFVMILLGAIVLGWRRPRGAAPAAAEEPAQRQEATEEPSGSSRFLGRGMLGILWEGVPWRVYFSYYRPSFHPWDHDNRDLIAGWKERYPDFGEAGAA